MKRVAMTDPDGVSVSPEMDLITTTDQLAAACARAAKHAYVTVDHTGVYVRDAATAAGTFIAGPGATEWTQIGSAPAKLQPGWSMRVGEWVATHREQ